MTVSVADPLVAIDLDTDAVRRTLAVARRALRAREAKLIVDVEDTPVQGAVLSAGLAPFTVDVAALVVVDEDTRSWSDEDVALLRDIAATLTATLRLTEDLKRHRAVVDNVPGLIFERRKAGVADARYTFLGSGKSALPVLRELLERGSVEREWHFVHPDDRAMLRDAMRASVEGESDLNVTFRTEDLEGRTRWVRSEAAVRREADGTAVWSGLCLDVTDVLSRSSDGPSVSSNDLALSALPVPPVTAASPEETTSRDTPSQGETVPDADDASMLHILLADDLDLNRRLICDMLSLDGYKVDSVADGAAAVEAVKGKSYDLVLMDMIMPGMDGMDATRAIRALPAPTCDVPIVALTAHSFREQLDNCLHAGMNATLTKPMSFEALSQAVSVWARSRRRAA